MGKNKSKSEIKEVLNSLKYHKSSNINDEPDKVDNDSADNIVADNNCNMISIYEGRTNFLQQHLSDLIKSANRSVKILNISFGWFIEIKHIMEEKITKSDTRFEILLLKRKRVPGDISYISQRAHDEFTSPDSLIMAVNDTLFNIFLFLVEVYTKDPKSRKEVIEKVKIKEYTFTPTMCSYIFDDHTLIFGPYIAKKCDNIPLFHIIKNNGTNNFDMSAFQQLMDHYNILSGDYDKRSNREYISSFTFYDGRKNIPIHEFIENHCMSIAAVLEKNKDHYENYITVKNSPYCNEFNDRYILSLKNDSFEGRFDAVMRHIQRKILFDSLDPLARFRYSVNEYYLSIKDSVTNLIATVIGTIISNVVIWAILSIIAVIIGLVIGTKI